jgi:hypothetical protein
MRVKLREIKYVYNCFIQRNIDLALHLAGVFALQGKKGNGGTPFNNVRRPSLCLLALYDSQLLPANGL